MIGEMRSCPWGRPDFEIKRPRQQLLHARENNGNDITGDIHIAYANAIAGDRLQSQYPR